MSVKKEGLLTDEQAMSKTGCGAGTRNACFSLGRGEDGFDCTMKTQPQVAARSGIMLGWRTNTDETDGRSWCPLGGVLINSKTE